MNEYISRKWLRNRLRHFLSRSSGAEHYAYNVIQHELDFVPADNVVGVNHGHWISKGYKLECSNCSKRIYLGSYDPGIHEEEKKNFLYCSHCGARMDEED